MASRTVATDPLIEAIDAAGQALLERARGGVTVKSEGDEPSDPPSLSEAVKVFVAVADWAERRAKIVSASAPKTEPKPKEAPFDRLRNKFNGTSAVGGAGGDAGEGDAA